MTQETLLIDGYGCFICSDHNPRFLLIQPVDKHDLKGMEQELRHLRDLCPEPFLLAAFQVHDWNDDLSPWPAPPVLGKQSFGGKGTETLDWLNQSLIPALSEHYPQAQDLPIILGGYSLAAFFALWSVHLTERFSAAACASPSVWYPGWIEFVQEHTPKAGHIYLSLGNREEKARNPVMTRVGEYIREQFELLQSMPDITSTLVWNEGNHFRNADIRTAKAFAWCMKSLTSNL